MAISSLYSCSWHTDLMVLTLHITFKRKVSENGVTMPLATIKTKLNIVSAKKCQQY
jgi:hypothetical protein